LKSPLLARGAYPQAAKPLSAANGVGRSPLLEQDTHARKRLFLDWQGADDTAALHDFYSTIFIAQRQAKCNRPNIR
jgi:hypothetical protein